MAEPTCVVNPFSYTTPSFSNESHEENPMYKMGESVSFGRYVCEELEWEKWSSFDNNTNRNRYVKEAEKYSKPGSVAQKKAYFEAHFKRMAALKAAALLEQANNSENTSGKTNIDQISADYAVNTNLNLHVEDNRYEQADSVPKDDEINNAGEFVVHQDELYSIGVNDNDGKNVNPPLPERKSSDKIDVYSASKKDENCKASNEESSGIPQICKLPLQTYVTEESSVTAVKRNPPLSSYIPSPARSANPIYPGKENYATPVKKKSSVTDLDKKKTPLRMSINRELNRIMSPVIKKLGSSSKVSKDCANDPSRTPAKASVSSVQVPPMTPDLSKRGVSTTSSPSMSKNKISSPIIPNSFCLRSGDRTSRRKQKLEDKFNATATEKAPQPSKFKEKAEAELNKFRQSFCFKSMASPDYYGDSGRFNSPKPKKESTNRKSPNEVRQANRTAPQNKSTLPPRRPSAKQIGLKSTKRTTHVGHVPS
ncbi:protein WVD2-like 7 isoform X2 [Chenopodium quinoa]|uniref:protein WVD2-like 7 isoform X2 n=1 Tax=Chenopodium quinoa TaxID=63459 RepID=UPI000B799D01|nr:protein WVD2-like 7 isoform X2 [Chenopodium quinoa]